MDGLVEEESRKLLCVAVSRIFANLRRLEPSFDFRSVTEPDVGPRAADREVEVKEDAEAYADRFKVVEADESPEKMS